jgi:hypothetical protein
MKNYSSTKKDTNFEFIKLKFFVYVPSHSISISTLKSMSRKKLLKNNQNKNAIKYSINDITV